ncbi:MAG: D-aminoacylase [Planctomycetes bacterium]|nr:D-aminoacylase [Planctomycetota bacterium]
MFLAAMHPWVAAFAMLASFAAGAGAQEPRFDLVLRGGVLVDPVARTTAAGDLALRDGRIAALGNIDAPPGTPVLHIDGLSVAPGFIDLHTHVDADVVREPDCANFLRMGVTTIITGNCGGSVAQLDAHFSRLERGGIGPNYGSLCGHGTVRTAVLGTANRAPSADELQRMGDLVDLAMQHGAFGLSTGLIYVPGTYADRSELTALAKVVGKHGGIYASHIRNENDHVLDAIAEALAIGRDAGVPVEISHVKCTGKNNHGRAEEVLAALQAARAAGQEVYADQYAYDASSTGLDVLFPTEELAVGREQFAARLRDPAFRQRMQAALLARMDHVGFGDFRYCRIANAKGHESLNGLLLPAAAKQKFGRDDRDAQADLAIELFIAAAPARVSMIYHAIGEADVERFLRADWIAVASDAGLRPEGGADRPHPRGSGNNPRVLGHYVRERSLLDLPTAIAKMTVVPARAFRLHDRGELRPGAFADLVVFDPKTIADRATWDDPTAHPVGIRAVFVNGQLAVDRGQVTGVRAGHVLRANGRRQGR